MSFIFKNKKETKWESQEEKFAELALDIYETDKELVIVSPLAGAREDDLDVSLEKDMLVIKGKRQDPLASDAGSRKYISQECFWGNFMKRIILPDEIEINKVQANLKNGMLIIKIPRIPKEQIISKIKVQSE